MREAAPKKRRNQRLAALNGRGFSRASHRFQWFTARLESRALARLRRPDFSATSEGIPHAAGIDFG